MMEVGDCRPPPVFGSRAQARAGSVSGSGLGSLRGRRIAALRPAGPTQKVLVTPRRLSTLRKVKSMSRILMAVVSGGVAGYLLHAWPGSHPAGPPAVETVERTAPPVARLAPVSLQFQLDPDDRETTLIVERRQGAFYLGSVQLTRESWVPQLSEVLKRTRLRTLALAVRDDDRFGEFVEFVNLAQLLPVERVVVLITPAASGAGAP